MTIKFYRRPDGVRMIEIEPGNAVNEISARRLGLIGADAKFSDSDSASAADSPPASGGTAREEILKRLPAAGGLS